MPRPGLLSCALLLAFTACATATVAAPAPATAAPPLPVRPSPPPRTPEAPAAPSLRERVVARAASALGEPGLSRVTREVSDDCTGFVRWAYRASGEDLVEGSVGNMLSIASRARAVRRGGRPLPGDLVFFRETYDRNGDHRRDDGVTHVGVVERVEPDGTVVFAHRATSGVKESRLNLRFPSTARAGDGRVLNDYIRRSSGRQRARLTGEQFAGYASLEALYRNRVSDAPVARAGPSSRGR
jgi:CHAP domain-containing protein